MAAEAEQASPRPQPKKKKNKKRKDWQTIFYIYLAASLFSAFYAPIQDADEVFNYWEPTHYLTDGTGSRTWEYSPEYAIRSWTYSAIHALVVQFGRFIPYIHTPVGQFFFLRMVLGFVYSACQTKFTFSIGRAFGRFPALAYTLIMATSTGMFHASTAYLPSSFAMYAIIVAAGEFINYSNPNSLSRGLIALGVGSFLGWPFAAVIGLPFVLEHLLRDRSAKGFVNCISQILTGAMNSVTLLVIQCVLDSTLYRKAVCVPWNIVAYNVFGGSDHGPDLFGVDPMDFYARNLLINFNIWFLLALVSLPLVLVARTASGGFTSTVLRQRLLTVAPFYLWFAIFSLQPHKEERFMYPAYPLVALSAALSFEGLIAVLGSPRVPVLSVIPSRFKFAGAAILALIAVNFSTLRIIRLHSGYYAPLEVYNPLHETGATANGNVVCLGKEWHRFPSSYFLPSGVTVGFVRSEFKGLLPGHFEDDNEPYTTGVFSAAGNTPRGMNNLNMEDAGKYVELSKCTFLVDSHFPSTTPTEAEPNHISDADSWERVVCHPYLDAQGSTTLDRLIWLPEFVSRRITKSGQSGAQWGEYCLLKRREKPAPVDV